MIAVLMISSLLNIAYLLPLVGRGFFLPAPDGNMATPVKMSEAPILVVLPPVATAFGCLVLFFYAGEIQEFLMPIVAKSSGG